MAMKHPIDEPDPSKSIAIKEIASSLGLPVVDVKMTKRGIEPMCKVHNIDEPSKSNDLDDMIAQSIKDQATTELMLKLCTIAIILIAILFLVSTFSNLSKYLTLRNFNSEERQLLTEPSKHNLLCIDGNKLVTITEPIMLITDTSYVTEYKSFLKTNCRVVKK